MKLTDVIRRPLITEKTTVIREDGRTLVFEVARDANKIDIRRVNCGSEINETKRRRAGRSAVGCSDIRISARCRRRERNARSRRTERRRDGGCRQDAGIEQRNADRRRFARFDVAVIVAADISDGRRAER